jgi:hypothetical protein
LIPAQSAEPGGDIQQQQPPLGTRWLLWVVPRNKRQSLPKKLINLQSYVTSAFRAFYLAQRCTSTGFRPSGNFNFSLYMQFDLRTILK